MGRAGVRELAGWSGALAVSLITAAQVASSARSELLFRDGDSLIVAMFARSLLAGGPADWALSSVLFVPETAVFAGLDALLPLEVDGVLAVNAVLNLLGLFGALRLVAGRRRPGSAPVAWSLLGLTVFSVIAMTETSASRDAFELASLSLTTTYYSGTVIAAVLSVGFVRRVVDRPAGGAMMLVLLGLTAAVSTLSNPLYAAWATAPLALLLTVLLLRSRERLRPALLLAVLLCGTAIGFVGRIPLQAWITNSGAGYVQPERWAESLRYYSDLFADRLSTPAGVVGGAIVLALLALAVHRTVRVTDTERASWLRSRGSRPCSWWSAPSPSAPTRRATCNRSLSPRYSLSSPPRRRCESLGGRGSSSWPRPGCCWCSRARSASPAWRPPPGPPTPTSPV
ncbi:hypothetical protein [Microbacterium sp. Se63.02b]|uniref:hypothetical protein n=1 Tax=Microbacterium sp. Se63.02b TaxID=2709304 RepID=UPI001FCE93DA|nr:hypothetical protein [Microbacterium sp. Se63.02b]